MLEPAKLEAGVGKLGPGEAGPPTPEARSRKSVWRSDAHSWYTVDAASARSGELRPMMAVQHKRAPADKRSSASAARPRPHAVQSVAARTVLQRTSSCACGGTCPRCQAKRAQLRAMGFSHGGHADARGGNASEHSSPGGELAAPSPPIQRKLAIGRTDDPAEAEADRIADQVMRMAEPGPIGSAPSQLSRKCAACENEDESAKLQTKRDGGGTLDGSAAPPIVHDVLRSPGQPLDAATRAFMEPRFGHDFSQVRVHTDTKAADSAQAVNARAFTVGRDVVFDERQYSPGTTAGAKLVAHELSHVLQQTGGLGSALSLQRDFWDDEEEEEEGGVFDWVSEQVEGAAEWASETGGETVDWDTESGGEAVEWVSDAGGEESDWASEAISEVSDSSAEAGHYVGIPYPKEGEVVCNDDGVCWQTRCEYSESGEEVCYWEPYSAPPPEFGEDEPKEGDISCTADGCFEMRCHLSAGGKWVCQWHALPTPPAPAPEPTLLDDLIDCVRDIGLVGLIARAAVLLFCMFGTVGGPGAIVACLKIWGIVLLIAQVFEIIHCVAARRATRQSNGTSIPGPSIM